MSPEKRKAIIKAFERLLKAMEEAEQSKKVASKKSNQ
jgi:hypothetical protein